MSFIRRYGFVPGIETITLIEGVVIEDLPPPGSIQGAGTGVAGIVGEFVDMSSGVTVSSTGAVTTKPQPMAIFSGADLVAKMGGFDPTLGQFGNAMGNGYVELRNKRFSSLVACAINQASALGTRLWRVLPGNASAINPNPVVPMQGLSVPAGYEFKTGNNRVRTAQRKSFSDAAAYATGVDGVATPTGLPAATQPLASAGSNFITSGVLVGDAIVLDVDPPATTLVTDNPLLIGAVTANVVSTSGYPTAGFIKIDSEVIQYAGTTATSFTGLTRAALGTAAAAHVVNSVVSLVNNAGTYRVTAVAATTLTIEKQDGSTFTTSTWPTGAALPFRLHAAATADTGGPNALSGTGGFTVPARPLDASIAQATSVLPTIAPPVATQTTWDPSSGLTLRTHPTSPGLAYTAAIQGVNPANSASLDALYQSAIDGYLAQDLPERDVNLIWAARKSLVIRNKLKSHVLVQNTFGVGRMAALSPDLTVQTTSAAIADADPGVGANRDETVMYSWPGAVTSVPEAVNTSIAAASGANTLDGILDVTGDGWLISVLSNLPPERNPGQVAEPVPTVLAPILGLQRGVSGLGMSDYIQMRQKGICGLIIDRSTGPQFQSGITTSLTPGQKNINRRRMAFFIEDSLAESLKPFTKLPLTTSLKDSITGETDSFLLGLLSPGNPPAQRINDYLVDDVSGNTPDLEAAGIFVLIVKVRTTPTDDFLVLQVSVGENVQITTAT